LLTCKIGNKTINCFDGEHSKETFKKWAEKNILICPVCGNTYEYCHGEFVSPYFRHKDKNICEDYFSESETEEHIKGKQYLYEWTKTIDGVTDVILESWIPETKQRPDISFKLDGEQYVIEYQCTPIASEYVKRHELYQTAGIHDIWILGTKKYLENCKYQLGRGKTIETHTPYYFDINEKSLILQGRILEESLPHKEIKLNFIYKFNLADFIINPNIKTLSLNNSIVENFIMKDIEKHNEKLEIIKKKQKIKDYNLKIISELNEKYEDLNHKIKFSSVFTKSSYYLWDLDCILGNHAYTFLIKNDSIDLCSHNKKYNGYNNYYINLKSIEFKKLTKKEIINFVNDNMNFLKEKNIEIENQIANEILKRENAKLKRDQEKLDRKIAREKEKKEYDIMKENKYKNILEQIIKIFNNNINEILEYRLDNSLLEKSAVLFFKNNKNINYIVCLDSDYYKIKYLINENINHILIDINNFYDENSIFISKVNDDYRISQYIHNLPKYNLINSLKEYRVNHFTFKKFNGYYNLDKFNFVKATIQLENMYSKIKEYIDNYCNNLKIYNNLIIHEKYNDITNSDINNSINKILYPLIYLADKNKHLDILNITFNVDFTLIDNNHQPWIIKDFINALNLIGIKNIENIK